MKSHPNEMWLFYNCESVSHKKTMAHAKSITKNINEFTFQHNKLNKLRWAEILEMLQLRPKDILNKSNKKYQEELAGHDFDDDNWLGILRNNPCMIKGPVVIMNDKAVLCLNPKDIYHLAPLHREQK